MMRSLWSGVSGLQAHQVAMDVEGNNISNVNTTGFKYSRADFGTMFSQTVKIATAPTDGRGGSNPLQIGLGVSVSSTTRIHSQGSVQTTDKNTDVAINGDGFFMVSDDGGLTNYLTRSGDFKLDAYGNFVNNAGFVVQGWNINWDDQTIDSSRTPQNIFIDPGMHIPAAKSTEVAIKANLNSGLNIGTSSRNLYALDSVHGWNNKTQRPEDENDTGTTQFYTTSKNAVEVTEKGVDAGSLFNANGTGLNLREGQGIWVSYADAKFTTDRANGANVFDPNLTVAQQNNVIFWGNKDISVTLDINLNGVRIQNDNIRSLDEAIAYINTFTAPTDTRDGTGVKAVKKADGSGIEFVNDNADGTTDNMKNIDLTVNVGNSAGERNTINYDANTGVFSPQGGNLTTAQNDTDWIAGAAQVGQPQNVKVVTAHKYIYSSNPVTIPPMINPDGGPAFQPNNGNRPTDPASANYWDAIQGSLKNTTERTFRTTEDLRELLQRDARYGVDYNGSGIIDNATPTFDANDINQAVKVVVTENGNFAISNANETSTIPANAGAGANAATTNPKNMSFNITAYSNKQGTVSTNDAFTKIFKAFDGPLVIGNQIKESEQLKLSAFSAGLEIYDSLGSKHTLEVQFVKQSTTQDGGNEWQMIIRVPEPAEINTTGEGPTNIIVGTARFNNDGSLASYTPRTINFSPNNGAAPNQQIKLSFGTSGSNDGLVSSNSASTLTGQATDGYTSGNLKPEAIRVDDKGNILGEFTNGKTFAVAKIAMASVANNSGLEEIGGNLFKVTANSGNIVVGEAGTGGRGEMKTSALEMSNVDLSRSLTELIIIQRGYQANSKTISTSDQMLQTLIQLKQ
ncbi:flagellar hook protein, epsilonproteobacterial variant [Campylobacter coli]|uniref:flagellar hook protein FlgE n=1 Tax=Campylobacter coli TaxID=195 RepID=UPI000707579B|nr:flagellar hook protein FlgE [Campylobacter coli]AOH50917.1 flagellar hook protein, epsilonproteobacterial variant [Campylobacter coli]EAH9789773.1 flagellar hook protein FlgE [Campylobacter coli]EAI5004191.1 flagellar hook protein FlgE [Campylobacter coli]EAI5392055.1 flagellar hook protein FlgE [Campylobacter coli]EAI5842249.1 flagellar hook protein FlgE [Campylobacter coli]